MIGWCIAVAATFMALGQNPDVVIEELEPPGTAQNASPPRQEPPPPPPPRRQAPTIMEDTPPPNPDADQPDGPPVRATNEAPRTNHRVAAFWIVL